MNYSKKLATISALAVAILSSCIEEKDLSQISKVPEPETYSEVTFNIGCDCICEQCLFDPWKFIILI